MMKKLQELLCFMVPIFTILTCLYFLIPSTEFLSREGYLRLSFKDDLWIKAMLRVLVVAFVVAATVFILKSKLQKRFKIKRAFFYIGTVSIVSVSVFAWTIVERLIARTTPSVMLTSYREPLVSSKEILVSVLFATFAVFGVWIIESVIDAVKNKKPSP